MKNVIAFDVTLPSMADIEDALKKKPLPPMTDHSYSVSGFVPHPQGDGEQFVLSFEGGVSFALTVEEKVIPSSFVAKRLHQELVAYKEASGLEAIGHIPRKMRSELKEKVMLSLLPQALSKSKTVIVYYRAKEKLLLVDDSSDSWASLIIRSLIHVFGTLKTTTIHVSNLKSGLQARLADLVLNNNKSAFDGLQVGGRAKLQFEKEKISLDQTSMDEDQIAELMRKGYQVIELELYDSDISIVFTHDFILKRIEFLNSTETDSFEHAFELWQHETSVKTLLVSSLLNKLTKLFGFSNEVEEDAA